MNKKLISALVIVVLAGIGTGAYFYGIKNNNESRPANNNSASQQSQQETKEVNLEDVMAATKAKFPTVKETKIYNEENDPNDSLGKPGFYIAGAAFWDTRTEYTASEDTPNKWGTDAGGSIEVYANETDATKRAEYLKGFQGGGLTDPGAFQQSGKYLVRASSELPKSQQDEIVAFLVSQVQ